MLRIIVMALMLVMGAGVAVAEEPKDVKQVMQWLSADMQVIFKSIMVEDFDSIAIHAEKVAYHQEPPVKHRLAMVAELKLDFPNFKGHDDTVHMASVAMQEAAKRKEMSVVLENYAKATQGCVACHETYRTRIKNLDLK